MKKYTTKEIQKKLLEIISDFDQFCKENNITYYLMGGSALGAMRHKGFIPWDDDIDVFMTYDEYHRFLKLAKEKLDPKKYFIQEENTEHWTLFLSQVRLNNTTFISNDFYKNKKMHHGLFIDIMCLYNAPKNIVKRYFQYLCAMALKIRALCNSGYYRDNKFKMFIIKSSKVWVNRYTKPLFISGVRRYQNKKVSYVGHFFGRARFLKTSFPKSFLGKTRYVEFENIKLPVMDRVEDYLTVRYGKDWNNIPNDKVLAKYPNHGSFVDLKKDYSKYISTYVPNKNNKI